MKKKSKANLLTIRKPDPFIIKLAKVSLVADFAIVFTSLLTIESWAKTSADVVFRFKITMRGGYDYYVPEVMGFVIWGGAILFPVLFFFIFSYLFWPLTPEEKQKYRTRKDLNTLLNDQDDEEKYR